MKAVLKLQPAHASVAILLIGFLLATFLHSVAGYHFPTPWSDEDWFLGPAINLAKRGLLQAPELNAPRGLFWMPDGFYVVYGALLKVLPISLGTARWISFGLTLAAATFLFLATRQLQIKSPLVPVAIALWLISPGCVLMANTARMEALMLAVVMLALLLVSHQHWLMGIAVGSLAILAHPAGAVPFLCLVAIALLLQFQQGNVLWPIRPIPAIVLGVVLSLWLAEGLYYLTNLDLVREQLAFQVARKAGRTLVLSRFTLWLLIVCGFGLFRTWQARRQLEPSQAAGFTLLFLLPLGFNFVSSVGQEMWYWVYGQGLASLLVWIAFLGLLTVIPLRDLIPFATQKWARFAFMVVLLMASTLLLRPDRAIAHFVHYTAVDISLHQGSRQEWQEFITTVTARLHQVDQSLSRTALVRIESPSGLLTALRQQQWSHLQFIYPTWVTPLDQQNPQTQADYLLMTLHQPEFLRQDAQRVIQEFLTSGQIRTENSFTLQSQNQTFELSWFSFQHHSG